jgi:hypothetical protein
MWTPPKHYPRGGRLSALEKNELKRRALEMVLLLFYVEDLRGLLRTALQTASLDLLPLLRFIPFRVRSRNHHPTTTNQDVHDSWLRRGDAIDGRQLLGREAQLLQRGHVLADLRCAAGTDDRGGHPRIAQHPGERHLCE